MVRRRLPRLGEKAAPVGAVSPNLELTELPHSVWIDARPTPDVARRFAQSVRERATVALHGIELRTDSFVLDGVEWGSLEALIGRVRDVLAEEPAAAWLLLGDRSGSVFRPTCVVQLGPPRLFTSTVAPMSLVRLAHPRDEVAEALARSLASP